MKSANLPSFLTVWVYQLRGPYLYIFIIVIINIILFKIFMSTIYFKKFSKPKLLAFA